ncbi:C-C motif chemokine 3 [Austrofundulus limnaeus]|uniref:C-C motif chemokine 3 n=1 Tax=Austrofundulus limnaeus TaxID=52670 RepID=A0A2I4D9M2_AUSLI|nr:PREDICTED: C-C motif chemokine 3-like [Austrofundulus limnaeus]
MKTFCLTLGLLMLMLCCCNAIPSAMQFSTAPGNCCFKFSSKKIPLQRVKHITKTHRSCLKKGFIFTTVLQNQICYSSNWALKTYNDKIEGSGSQ